MAVARARFRNPVPVAKGRGAADGSNVRLLWVGFEPPTLACRYRALPVEATVKIEVCRVED